MRSFLRAIGWVVLIAAGAVVFWKTAIWAGSLPDLFRRPGPDSPHYKTMEEAGKDLYGLMDVVYHAEEMRDSAKYLEAAGLAAKKSVEADLAWERWQAEELAAQRGLKAGLEQGIFEYWAPHRYSAAEKLEMLAQSRGMDPADLRYLKAQFEVLFQDEYVEKYGRHEHLDEESAAADEVSGTPAGTLS
ncbi:MAG: hypothetical protein MOGMAGMI_01586 [Candidatus Omnitrophica bacterium]|nr:hypothetical protein [Candidatus Omnitrophota bacterium]